MAKNNAKMRILVATGIYPPDIGGPATYSKLLKDALPAFNIDITILSFGRVRKFPVGIRHIFYFVLLLIKGSRSDLIYALDPASVGFPSLLASNVLNKRFLLRISGDYAWEQGTARFGVNESLDTFSKKKNGYSLYVLFLKFLQKHVAAGADLIIVPSKYLKKIVCNWGIKPKKIKIIYNAFDVPENIAKKQVLRQMMNLHGKIILSVGRLVPWKGFDALIHVMKKIVKKEKDAKLLIIGSGIEEKKLKKQIEKLHAQKYVTLVGRLPHDILLRYIRASDIFVLNTFYEGFSHQILECMALNIPVITTKVGGNVEIVNSGENGLLVSYNDKAAIEESIITLLNNKQLILKFTSNAISKVKQFNRKKMLTELVNTIDEI